MPENTSIGQNSGLKFDINSIFPTYKDLYTSVMGKEPPKSGKKNIETARKNLARHVRWGLVQEVHPEYPSKRAVIIHEIYDPPLPADRATGRSGIYINDLRPLLLKWDSFDGKWSELENMLGLFSRYADERRKSEGFRLLIQSRASIYDFDLFSTNRKGISKGEFTYNRLLKYQMKSCIERALNSLQNEGIVIWEEYYVLLPELLILDAECTDRIAAKKELQSLGKKRRKAMRKAAGMQNSVLDADLLSCLLVGTKAWDNRSYEDYKAEVSKADSYEKIPTIDATERQRQAIENYQLFIRQVAYGRFLHRETLPLPEELPDNRKFFLNPQLVQQYNDADKEYREKFFGQTRFWKAIRYKVIDPVKAERYHSEEPTHEIAARLTRNLLAYMDGRMEREKVNLSAQEKINEFGGIGTTRRKQYGLNEFNAAKELHKHLKDLYQ